MIAMERGTIIKKDRPVLPVVGPKVFHAQEKGASHYYTSKDV
jgi:hypothetical protein